MKKIIGILGVVMIAGVMFFSTNNLNGSDSDTSLARLITMNTANAEPDESPEGELLSWYYLDSEAVYGTIATFSTGVSFPINGIPINMTGSYTTKTGIVAQRKFCTWTINWNATCDQSKVGIFPVNL